MHNTNIIIQHQPMCVCPETTWAKPVKLYNGLAVEKKQLNIGSIQSFQSLFCPTPLQQGSHDSLVLLKPYMNESKLWKLLANKQVQIVC